ncbi:MAG TPA: hypothetical protein VGB89_01500 [Bacteroidota bacterium]
MKTIEERKIILSQKIILEVGRGARLESQTDTMAVLIYGEKTNHLLHFFIGLFTFGLWWIVWIFLAMGNKQTRWMIIANEEGQLSVRQV